MVPHRGSCWSRPSSTAAQGDLHRHSKTAAQTGDPQRPKSNYDTCIKHDKRKLIKHNTRRKPLVCGCIAEPKPDLIIGSMYHLVRFLIDKSFLFLARIFFTLALYIDRKSSPAYLLHCFSFAFCTKALDRAPP